MTGGPDDSPAAYSRTNHSGFSSRGPIHHRPARKVFFPCNPIIRAATGHYGRVFLGATSGRRALVALQGERVANPEFYPVLRNLGFDNLPAQSTMGAITFSEVVVSHVPFTNGLLFHELVHVEQYRQLGIQRFSELYVRGFLSGGSYGAIPLEVNAYTLGGRFEANPSKVFSAEDEVKGWALQGRL